MLIDRGDRLQRTHKADKGLGSASGLSRRSVGCRHVAKASPQRLQRGFVERGIDAQQASQTAPRVGSSRTRAQHAQAGAMTTETSASATARIILSRGTVVPGPPYTRAPAFAQAPAGKRANYFLLSPLRLGRRSAKREGGLRGSLAVLARRPSLTGNLRLSEFMATHGWRSASRWQAFADVDPLGVAP